MKIAIPDDWAIEPAGPGGTGDSFRGDGAALRISRLPLPNGTTVKAWAEAHIPDRATEHRDHRDCTWRSGGFIAMPAPGVMFSRSHPIAGHPAVTRSMCSTFDAAIDLGDEVLVISLKTTRHQMTGDAALFDLFAGSLKIDTSR